MFLSFWNAARQDASALKMFTLTLQKSRALYIQGVKGEAVTVYCEPLATKEMQLPSAFPKGKQHGDFGVLLEFTNSEVL